MKKYYNPGILGILGFALEGIFRFTLPEVLSAPSQQFQIFRFLQNQINFKKRKWMPF